MLTTGNGFYLVIVAGAVVGEGIDALRLGQTGFGIAFLVISLVLMIVAGRFSRQAAEYNYKQGELDGFEKGRATAWEQMKGGRK
jgi:membrane protein implicated in regulation of membrane protease activity